MIKLSAKTIPVVLSKSKKATAVLVHLVNQIKSQRNFSFYILHIQEINKCPNQTRNVNNHNHWAELNNFVGSSSTGDLKFTGCIPYGEVVELVLEKF